jgi:transglutaminase-like putative cysteine protease
MNQRRHIAVVGGLATLLAAAPLSTVFIRWSWLVDCVLVVTVVVGTAVLARALRAPLVVQVLAMTAALLLFLTWLFPAGGEVAGFLPGGATLRHFTVLLNDAGQDMRDYAVPVPDRAGLLFLTTVGVGLVALAVDVTAVGLRRPALAGLPMLAIYSVPVAVHQDSVPFASFVLGASGFLWLLATDNVDRVRRFGRRFTGDGRDVDMWEPSPLAAAGRRLALVGVILAVAVPTAVPGMTGGLLDHFGSGTGVGPGIGGGGQSVNLFTHFAGQLNLDKTIALATVRTDDPRPYYLTLATAGDLTMTGFQARPPRDGQPVTREIRPPDVTAPGTDVERYRATVTVQQLDMGFAPVYQTLVGKVEGLDRTWRYDGDSHDVYSTTRSTSKGRTYSFDYVHVRYTAEALAEADPLAEDDPIMRAYTETPRLKEVSDLVARLVKGKTDQYAKVRAIYDYLNGPEFTYALSTGGTSGADIRNFLRTKQGYCEQYAGAMAWMVREANIPARVALGFARGASGSSPYTLTNRNLHAWTEVYFQGYGWVPFDPTPSVGVVGSVGPPWAPDLRGGGSGTDGEDQLPHGGGTGANPSTAPSAEAGGSQQLPPSGPGGPQPLDPWLLASAAGGIALILLLLAPALRRVSLRRRRTPPARASGAAAAAGDGPRVELVGAATDEGSRLRAHAAWAELLDTMADFRMAVDPAETPRATGRRVVREAHLPRETAESVSLLRLAEERARYARQPLAGADLGGALRAVRRAVAERVSVRTRLRATLLPPSVLRRWREATVHGYGSATARAGATRDAVLRALSPRRLLTGRGSR